MMMDDPGLRILQLAGAGYCCSQIIVKLFLDDLGRDNPDLVRAAQGLCHGLGECSGTCGILTGGACALGLYAGRGTDGELTDERLPLLLESYVEWFRATATARHGGITCGDITGGDCSAPNPSRCGVLLADAHAALCGILANAGFDITTGRGDDDAF
ncbi:hypothetical protein GGQ74_000103 [Desulfobaculum xiamenense]|uniref:C_GCAxxG_C_C family protein n=1 Tax=Desulfobaculum xiamenense TaxID=995050 RepID=A0A846QJW3_9BACT|nr:DV_1555 family C-GCAxxG-C-C protein [Desulfobaculum xiamenense]NJB66463.1 hypothetical protein [Desulfobaculum xiamenense]